MGGKWIGKHARRNPWRANKTTHCAALFDKGLSPSGGVGVTTRSSETERIDRYQLVTEKVSMLLLTKTPKARAALQSRAAELLARERQLLILCNGHRPVAEIAKLFGSQTTPIVDDLRRRGYLAEVESDLDAAATLPASATSAKAPHEGRSSRPQPLAGVERPAAAAPAVAAPRNRRSIAATKMYVIGLLQLIREMEATSLAVSLHTSVSEDELMAYVVQALRFIEHRSGVSYARQVATRLAEIVPEGHLPILEALRAEWMLEPAA